MTNKDKITTRAAAEALATHLREKRVDAACFVGPDLYVFDFKHIRKEHDGLPYLLETVTHEWLHYQHPTWDHRRLEAVWRRKVTSKLHLLTEFARGLT